MPQTQFGLIAAVFVADQLDHELSDGRPSSALTAALAPGGYGEQFELAARLPGWRALAAELAGDLAEAQT